MKQERVLGVGFSEWAVPCWMGLPRDSSGTGYHLGRPEGGGAKHTDIRGHIPGQGGPVSRSRERPGWFWRSEHD